MLGRSGTLNFGSTAPDLKYVRIVRRGLEPVATHASLRDNCVRRAISRMDRCSRNAHRQIMLKNAMSITPFSPAAYSQGEGVTWVNSQWKLHAYPGHFRVQINSQGAVFTAVVRCGNRRAVGCHQINVRRIQFGVSCPESKVQRHPPGRIGRGRPHGANPVALGKQIGNRPEAPQTPVKRLKRQPARPSAV